MITAPPGIPARPTTDFAKSGLFNLLLNEIDFEGKKVLDLFAGLGGISMEFISRDVESVTSVDANFKSIEFIKETATKFGIKNLKVVRMDCFKFLRRCEEKYDLIFADPPFDLEETDELLPLIFERNILQPNGLVIIEHQSKRQLKHREHIYSTRTYGNCSFSFGKSAMGDER